MKWHLKYILKFIYLVYISAKCATECKQCKVSDPHHCTECRLPGLYLQQGKCLQKCKDGFYPDRQNKCHGMLRIKSHKFGVNYIELQ